MNICSNVVTAGTPRIGAATTHHEIETSATLRARYPEMGAMISRVANLRVRSVGTLGGNLCFADPHSRPGRRLHGPGRRLCRAGRRRMRAAARQRGVPDYLRHLVAVHARQALRDAFASAT